MWKKQQFIHLTGNAFEKAGLIVKRAEGDADLLIAITACISSMLKPTCAVTEDTDNLALLLHYSEPFAEPLYMSSANRTISINTMKLLLPPPIVNIVLFLHLQSGCDTTSRPKSIGKLTALSKAGQLQDVAEAFYEETTREDIITNGESDVASFWIQQRDSQSSPGGAVP